MEARTLPTSAPAVKVLLVDDDRRFLTSAEAILGLDFDIATCDKPDEAMRLPADARARLAAELLGSLDDGEEDDALDPAEHEAAWSAEIAERMRQIDSGEVKAVPWSEARRRITRATAGLGLAGFP